MADGQTTDGEGNLQPLYRVLTGPQIKDATDTASEFTP
jgi:hypothetical protein